MKKIGILGGTFDPVHLGHIGLAEDALSEGGLDEIIFMPAQRQPFKLNKKITSGDDRYAMLKIATEDNPAFSVSSRELDSDEISYTYYTLRALKEEYGEDCSIYFITGTDAFLKIEFWKEAPKLLREYSFIIGTRPGYREKELKKIISKVRKNYGTSITNIDNRQRNISSTLIRERLAAGGDLSDLVPDGVGEYIREHGLYI